MGLDAALPKLAEETLETCRRHPADAKAIVSALNQMYQEWKRIDEEQSTEAREAMEAAIVSAITESLKAKQTAFLGTIHLKKQKKKKAWRSRHSGPSLCLIGSVWFRDNFAKDKTS